MNANRTTAVLQLGDISIDRDAMIASIGDNRLDLTQQQYAVLVQVALERGRPVSQVRLAYVLWGSLPRQYRRNIGVLISRLRTKLAGSRRYRLVTMHKRGYALVPADDFDLPEDSYSGP